MKGVVRSSAAFFLVALVSACALWLLARGARGHLETVAPTADPVLVKEAQDLRNVDFDLSNLPTPYRDIHVVPKNESPLLAALVARGELPPLKERMPEDPVVMVGDAGIGKYGGTMRRLADAESDIGSSIYWRLAGTFFCRWSPLGYPIKPYIAKSIVPSPDRRVWTITLRKGMRWSNGDPYTADDVLYWWNDEVNNSYLGAGIVPDWLLCGGKPPTIEKIDEFSFRVTFAVPYALFMEQLCTHQGGNMVGVPSKFLRPYHPDPKIGNQAIINRDMKGFKQPSPDSLYHFIRGFQNTSAPTLSPWIYKSFRSQPPQVFVRNPYFFVVDTQGNQLPYIDRVQMETRENKQIMAISVANGDSSMQDRAIDFTAYTEFMSRRRESGTSVLHWYPATRQIWVLNPNSNRQIIPGDSDTASKEKLLSDKRFRQAMSVAINRKQIIEAEYYGLGEPSQVSPGPMSPFDNPDLAKKFTEFDPAHANKLLDDLGLTHRDYENYRTFPDGSRMTFFIDFCEFTGEGPVQFIIDDWKAVGVRAMRHEISRSLFQTRADACDFDFNVWKSESDIVPLLEPSYFVLRDGNFANAWCRWYKLGGYHGAPQATISGVNPNDSENGKPMYKAVGIYEKALQTVDLEEQKKLFREIQEIAAENVWTIGITSAPPELAVISSDLKNVPKRALVGATFSNPSNTGVETYYFDHPPANPSADAELVESIAHPTNRPGAADGTPTSSSLLGWFFKIAFPAILLAGAVMVSIKHPFAMRRFFVLVPMLVLISVIVFTIIQMPPGDFISNRKAQLEAIHDPNMKQQLDDLRTQFHTDQPMWKNYLRWTGLTWFVTFSASDEGLLQGNLGRSMESGLPVNDLVGDRITVTFLLSLGTVLFTWMLALPIGIYSAIRQYAPSDYALTIIGFIGMSVPGFLLALVLMAATGLTGLYSPEFATQPGWTVGKIIDLSRHLWIPVLVLTIGGTAGMIRVMRANLLDELKKAYVTTARAKGVRPIKLLLKYPVRIALNPFVSGIGGLFPALVSGGSIVAIVLSLPMVGPLLLTSLFSQDIYIAASMLMVLSTLGVLGTLVSDLLLLWLDPRIRFEAGTR